MATKKTLEESMQEVADLLRTQNSFHQKTQNERRKKEKEDADRRRPVEADHFGPLCLKIRKLEAALGDRSKLLDLKFDDLLFPTEPKTDEKWRQSLPPELAGKTGADFSELKKKLAEWCCEPNRKNLTPTENKLANFYWVLAVGGISLLLVLEIVGLIGLIPIGVLFGKQFSTLAAIPLGTCFVIGAFVASFLRSRATISGFQLSLKAAIEEAPARAEPWQGNRFEAVAFCLVKNNPLLVQKLHIWDEEYDGEVPNKMDYLLLRLVEAALLSLQCFGARRRRGMGDSFTGEVRHDGLLKRLGESMERTGQRILTAPHILAVLAGLMGLVGGFMVLVALSFLSGNYGV